MAETAARAYKVTTGNAPDTTPNNVAVVDDGTGLRQVVVNGAGDGSGTFYDGSPTNPVNVLATQLDQLANISIAGNATSSGSLTGLNGVSAANIHLTGTFVGTVQCQMTVDGTTWVNITGSQQVINAATGAYLASGNMTAPGIYQVDIAGSAGVRVITTAYTSGTVTGVVKATNATAQVSIDGAIVLGAGASAIGTLAAGAATIGNVQPVGRTTGGGVNYSGAVGGTATQVKSGAGTVYSITVGNNSGAAAYLQMFALLAASVTLGSTAPTSSYFVPSGGSIEIAFPIGKSYATGITVAGTTTRANATGATLDINLTYT